MLLNRVKYNRVYDKRILYYNGANELCCSSSGPQSHEGLGYGIFSVEWANLCRCMAFPR